MNISSDKAIAAQMGALPHAEYEVGIFDPEADRMLLRRWNRETLDRSTSYLRAQNAGGKHIYVRPAGAHPYSLVDDLGLEAIEAMRRDGFAPALVIETSPGNFQAWVNHGRDLPADVSTAVAKELAATYGGDPSSADWRHFGRLAGFTNRKAKYQQPNGHYPFVKLIEATGCVAAASDSLIKAAEQRLVAEKTAAGQARARFREHSPSRYLGKSIQDFRNDARYAGDNHRTDLAYATYALSRGASLEDVEAAIRTRDLSHKGNERRQRDYIDRTVGKAREQIAKAPSLQR